MEFNVAGYVFVFVENNDGGVVAIEVPALGNGVQPFTITLTPAQTVAYAEASAQCLADMFG